MKFETHCCLVGVFQIKNLVTSACLRLTTYCEAQANAQQLQDVLARSVPIHKYWGHQGSDC